MFECACLLVCLCMSGPICMVCVHVWSHQSVCMSDHAYLCACVICVYVCSCAYVCSLCACLIVHVHMCVVCVRVWSPVYVQISDHVCVHVWSHLCACLITYFCVHVWSRLSACAYIYIWSCLCACLITSVYMRIYLVMYVYEVVGRRLRMWNTRHEGVAIVRAPFVGTWSHCHRMWSTLTCG